MAPLNLHPSALVLLLAASCTPSEEQPASAAELAPHAENDPSTSDEQLAEATVHAFVQACLDQDWKSAYDRAHETNREVVSFVEFQGWAESTPIIAALKGRVSFEIRDSTRLVPETRLVPDVFRVDVFLRLPLADRTLFGRRLSMGLRPIDVPERVKRPAAAPPSPEAEALQKEATQAMLESQAATDAVVDARRAQNPEASPEARASLQDQEQQIVDYLLSPESAGLAPVWTRSPTTFYVIRESGGGWAVDLPW